MNSSNQKFQLKARIFTHTLLGTSEPNLGAILESHVVLKPGQTKPILRTIFECPDFLICCSYELLLSLAQQRLFFLVLRYSGYLTVRATA